MKIHVDPDLCIGSANCVHLAKGVFVLNDEDIAEVADPGAAGPDEIELARASCPTAAISVEEEADAG
jgi:ferredoxin